MGLLSTQPVTGPPCRGPVPHMSAPCTQWSGELLREAAWTGADPQWPMTAEGRGHAAALVSAFSSAGRPGASPSPWSHPAQQAQQRLFKAKSFPPQPEATSSQDRTCPQSLVIQIVAGPTQAAAEKAASQPPGKDPAGPLPSSQSPGNPSNKVHTGLGGAELAPHHLQAGVGVPLPLSHTPMTPLPLSVSALPSLPPQLCPTPVSASPRLCPPPHLCSPASPLDPGPLDLGSIWTRQPHLTWSHLQPACLLVSVPQAPWQD